ncbi:type II toxin-antitoxin system VapB family antitoxin [Homoserinimonas sp. A447]
MKTMIDVDDEALMAAARELGTATKKDTVNAALTFAATRHARVSALLDDPHSYGIGADIGDAEVMSAARR